ncbi:hypothetical protein EPA93_42230 [Ktedonosporobacter rubrisoli]|uniref:Uncharacterized protein n=1 Tax=Ktedonosporobacter rubrisoli TaxID=2509675 RepID=A0A4P6K234_KTERU|nr:hypothetical protein [Ktedonosporobacter rubrisoli]QBD82248.1 hypothetical protein EPA93_42230 [Ktedonosporobacter rubrisoli]
MQRIFLTCNKRALKSLADELGDLLKERYQSSIELYGVTNKCQDGFILIIWEQERVPDKFKERLGADEDVFDYVVYEHASDV